MNRVLNRHVNHLADRFDKLSTAHHIICDEPSSAPVARLRDRVFKDAMTTYSALDVARFYRHALRAEPAPRKHYQLWNARPSESVRQDMLYRAGRHVTNARHAERVAWGDADERGAWRARRVARFYESLYA